MSVYFSFDFPYLMAEYRHKRKFRPPIGGDIMDNFPFITLLYVRDTVSRKWQKLNAKTVVLCLTTIRHQVPPIALLVRPVDQNYVYCKKEFSGSVFARGGVLGVAYRVSKSK